MISQNLVCVALIKSQITLQSNARSSTVENYLKAIYIGDGSLDATASGCCPWGSWPSALGVTPGHRNDDGQDARRVGAGRVRALRRRGADRGRTEARGARAASPSPDRALSRAGDGLLVGRGARRSRAARARGHRSAVDRMDEMLGRPEADPHGDPIPERRGTREAAGGADAADLPARHDGHRHARDRSGQGVPALHRAAPPQARRGDRSRSARRRRRQRPRARQERSAASRSARGRRRSCWCRSRHVAAPVSACRARVRADRRAESRGAPRTNLSGYMDFHFNKPEFERRPARLPSLRPARHALLLRHASASSASWSWSTRSSKGSRRSGELELEQAYVDFLLVTILQRARRDDADADWHHQRAARAAGLLRRRAAVHRHGDRADDLVRRRRRRARRDRPRLALPGVRHRAAQRRGVQRRRGHSRGAAEGLRIQRRTARRSPGDSSTSAIAG